MSKSLVSVWDDAVGEDVALTVDEAAILLALNDRLRRDWKKYNAQGGRRGRLIVVDEDICRRVLGSRTPAGRDGLDGTWLSEAG